MASVVIAHTSRLRLRTWTLEPADIHAAFSLLGDPWVMEKMVGAPLSSKEAAAERLETYIEHYRRYRVQKFAVEWRETSEVIGLSGFTPFDPDRPHQGVFEMSFQFLPPWWGQGLAVEAGHAAVTYAESLRPECLVAGTLGAHPASDRILRTLGFVRRGTIVWPDNGQRDPYYERRPAGSERLGSTLACGAPAARCDVGAPKVDD